MERRNRRRFSRLEPQILFIWNSQGVRLTYFDAPPLAMAAGGRCLAIKLILAGGAGWRPAEAIRVLATPHNNDACHPCAGPMPTISRSVRRDPEACLGRGTG